MLSLLRVACFSIQNTLNSVNDFSLNTPSSRDGTSGALPSPPRPAPSSTMETPPCAPGFFSTGVSNVLHKEPSFLPCTATSQKTLQWSSPGSEPRLTQNERHAVVDIHNPSPTMESAERYTGLREDVGHVVAATGAREKFVSLKGGGSWGPRVLDDRRQLPRQACMGW